MKTYHCAESGEDKPDRRSAPDLQIGDVYGKDSLFMSMHIGTATAEDGNKYTLCTNMNGSPLIRSEKTGNHFSIGWQEILSYARKAGIDKEIA